MLKLTKKLLQELDSEDSNLLKVAAHLVFRAPKHSKDLYVVLRVKHMQSGIDYQQLVQLPINVARGLAHDLATHAELDPTSGPDF